MKIFFVVVLVLNLLMEGLAAASLIFSPLGLTRDVMPAAGNWEMNYGFAALAISTTIFWIWPHRTHLAAVTVALGLLLTFHICLTLSLGIAGNQIAPTTAHAIMAVLCAIAFTQRRKWCV